MKLAYRAAAEGNIKLQAAAGGFYVGTCGFECVQYTDCSRRLALPLLTPVYSFTAALLISPLSEDKQNGAARTGHGKKIIINMPQRWVCYTE